MLLTSAPGFGNIVRMLKIRLKRVGRKHDPSFRLVVVESTRGPKSGDYIENLGSYDARQDSKNINAERATYWLGVGARPSDTAHNLLVELGIITGKKVNVLPKKTPQKTDEQIEAEKTAAAAPKAEAPKEEVPEEEPEATPVEEAEATPEETPEEVPEESAPATEADEAEKTS